ncbi:hypothetical protein [Phycisphaera mikurensis]|uniref:General secretion pathway protein M n=1 Tax=Phycisphaera mikurensis (strain NBRC 102666 / KCTC 22515 / FYK2301M01) TaxID=1142394 RepID=I0IE72_PHYMF|nr:hypothetical protein [Phycisphaera mikurensis]MBB6441362.1 hypothetical protein [Phycisphaera mikurensis]BAM03560.1 hypothetical protein PSMK_14010 [Phycisphaera mikurensis NBRC 102666]
MNAREKRVVIAGAALLLVGVAWRGGGAEAIGRWGDARARLAAEGDRVAELGRRAEQRDAVAGRLRQRLGPGAAAAPAPLVEVQAAYPAEVRAALGDAGLGVESVAVQGIERVKNLGSVELVRVRVQGEADGTDLPAVLAATRAVPRPTRVEEIQLERQDGDGWGVRLRLATPALRSGGDR